MPTKAICRECGHVLLEEATMPDDWYWYEDLYAKLNGKCPKCDRALLSPSELKVVMRASDVDVKPNSAFMRSNPAAGAFRRDDKKKRSCVEGFDERLTVEGSSS